MKVSDLDILIAPGHGGGSPDHWYARWVDKLSTARRIEQADWNEPNYDDWIAQIADHARKTERPIVLVGHSLGALSIVHAAPLLADMGARAAFLVAPPSQRVLATIPEIDPRFSDIPSTPLPFPSVLVASRDDPYATYEESEAMARDWGSTIADAGNAGHINNESGHGPWPEGLMRFAGFLKTL
ncbi:alpha/beta fold hydrolase [Methylocella sp. CPCC 101449]|uniref:RBBP9/YdeN family alpha/beta hydrolase n=1 Tax=Methylocella sp. CPCC 101449 TaxID=2987531 RepID=UPI002890A55C|nr:alpha/beta fold hydrolase [Methylocella sp. CPCC 101449]MDT2021108.1 alpha/beta fold hydrolase [Methylocella sp. CPCC 101449]